MFSIFEWTISIYFLLVEAKAKYSWLDFDESNVAPLPPFRCDHFFFSLIVKKVTSQTFYFPSAFLNLPLFPSISALSSSPPTHAIRFFFPPLFAPDQLIMSGKEGHHPEVISWVLSGWCISPSWWRNTLIPERLAFSFPLRLQREEADTECCSSAPQRNQTYMGNKPEWAM